MESFLEAESQIVLIMMVVSIVAIVARYFKLPYTVALVLAGLALAVQDLTPIELTPELVLGLFLPPLLFEAAFHLQLRNLRVDIGAILAMAVPGIVVSMFIVGGVLAATGVLSLPVAMLFGALISATDPVAVVATFRAVGAPKRLTTLMEGESLFNDGTAIVLFQIVLIWVLEGTFSPVGGVISFFVVSGGGLLVGLVLGYAVAKLIAQIDDYLIEITLTTILAYGSYLLAEQFHVSGVLAVVAAGLVNGNLGYQGMSPTTRIVLTNFWEYLAFVANSLVFILIGMSVELDIMVEFAWPAVLAVVAVLAARAIVTYSTGASVRLFQRGVSLSYMHVMFWGGLRGAVSLALVLSLPYAVSERSELLAMTFAVVLFTLLAQATTLPLLLKRLGLAGKADPLGYERLQGQLLAIRAAHRHLDRLYHEGAVVTPVRDTVRAELEDRDQELASQMRTLLAEHPELEVQVVALTRREVMRAQRAALDDLARNGLLGEEALAELQAELDEAMDESEMEPISVVDSATATG